MSSKEQHGFHHKYKKHGIYVLWTVGIIAAFLILTLLATQIAMSGKDGWPQLTLKSFFSGEWAGGVKDFCEYKDHKDPYIGPDGTDTVKTDPPETKPPETEPPETELTDTEPQETEPIETEPQETEPIETEPQVTYSISASTVTLEVGESACVQVTALPDSSMLDYSLLSTLSGNAAVAVGGDADGGISIKAVGAGAVNINVYYDSSFVGAVVVTVNEKKKEELKQPDNIDPAKPMIALTFDDGPSTGTGRLLDTLKKYNVHATFFVTGNRISKFEKRILRMVDEGHELGIHTWSHVKLTNLSYAEIRKEVSSTRDALYKLTGVNPLAVRPPYGSVNDDVKRASQEDGFLIVNWSIDSEDWKSRNVDMIYDEIMENLKDGRIILCHDLHEETCDAMEVVIPALIEKGYQLVTVSELLSYNKGGVDTGVVYRYRVDK